MKTKKTVCALLMLTIPCFAFAKSGAVNYSWGADALATMHDFVVTMMMYVPKVLYNAECWRIKSKIFQNKTNCFSTIYERNEIYNLS